MHLRQKTGHKSTFLVKLHSLKWSGYINNWHNAGICCCKKISNYVQLRNRIDIFCSTSVRSRTLQKSSNEIKPSLSSSASMIVRSAIEFNCSSVMLSPTIIVKTARSSSLDMRSSPSKSYILNATENKKKKTTIKIIFNIRT